MRWPNNQVEVMTLLFWNTNFGISNCRMSKQMTFFELWDKTGEDMYLFKNKFWFSKFDIFWPELDLILGQMWKWVSPSNSTPQMTHKTGYTRYIFMRLPRLTWPCLWPVFSISLLRGIFIIPSQAFWQGVGMQLTLVWSRQQIRRYDSALNFDLTMTRYVKLLG